MAISGRLKAFLDEQRIPYTAQKHPAVYTAQEIAAAQHVPGRQLAKCVLLATNSGVALAVLPAIQRVEFARLKSLLKATRISLASEADIKQAFPDVEIGAMSLFGNLYSVPVALEQSLAESNEVVCNAGTHTDTITVSSRDVLRTVKPVVGAFGMSLPRQKSRAKKPAKKPARKKPSSAKARKPSKRPARRKR